MIKNILHTIGSKIFIALASFIILLLNAQILGSIGVGTIGLIILGITLFQLISNVFNSGIVYYSFKLDTYKLLIITYLWSFFTVGIFWCLNFIYPVFESEYANDIYILAFIHALGGIHNSILIGNEEIQKLNYTALLKTTLIVIVLCFYFFYLKIKTVDAFINALYISYIFTYLFSIVLSFPFIKKSSLKGYSETIKDILNYGIYIQLASFFQLLNYRLSYYILDAFSGRSSLGIYSGSVQVSEALILPGKSIATVQYARISKRNNIQYAQKISALFLKISVLATLVGVIILFIIPESLYLVLFGNEFVGVKLTICILSIGILFQSAEMILSQYFSGTGQQKLNSYSAFIGLVVTFVGGFILIPKFNATGAAITAALSYLSMLIYLTICMKKQPQRIMSAFKPKKSDYLLLKRLFIKSK